MPMMPTFQAATLLAFLASAAVSVKAAVPTCSSDGLCFVQNPIGNSSNVIGLAFPEHQAETPELMASLRIELPYGFAAFSLESPRSSNSSFQSLAASAFPFVDLAQQEDPAFIANITYSDFIVQLSNKLPNNTLAPVGNANITISRNFFIDTSHYHILVRCQNCSASSNQAPSIFSQPSSKLAFTESKKFPVYLNNVTHSALLPLDGSEETDFIFDGTAARFSNYTTMLKIAGFV